ncbi:MAG: carbamoyltransferase C-terminal domain-containing protein [Acidobacteriota bacterium]
MKVLGLFDWHNCGAALVDGLEVTAAVEEERLSRRKVDFGLPLHSMDAVLTAAGAAAEDLDAIAVCGIYDPTPVVRWRPERFAFERSVGAKWRLQYRLWTAYYALRGIPPFRVAERIANRRILDRQLGRWPSRPADVPFELVDHHLCHARLGYHGSGFDHALIFVVDGSGDGYSTALYRGRGGELEFLAGASEKASLGKFYANASLGLGFQKLTGEGKVMGLAADGDPAPYRRRAKAVLHVEDPERLKLRHRKDLLGNGWALEVRRDAERYRREDIAAAVQAHFEDVLAEIVGHHVERRGVGQVVLVGGAAMNVKANQRLRELPGVRELFVPPAMTDAGVAAGAALDVAWRRAKKPPPRRRQKHSYLGPGYGDDQILAAIRSRGLEDRAERFPDVDAEVGRRVASGQIVARFTGRLEHGPRALGHRSILALASDPTVEERLNSRLGRDEFMPFAPAIQEEHAARYLDDYTYSPFMVETFDVKPEYRDRFPAVVHTDGTLRPQVVRRSVAPGFWRVIEAVGERTGDYLVLNTSFNLHGEPIVCSPEDALRSFGRGAADALALGPWLLEAEDQP